MADTSDAVVIGFIVTVVVLGIAGGVTLTVFLCIRWREYLKTRQTAPPASRRRTRRRRTIRVQHASNEHANHLGQVSMELPPPYSEHDPINPPPYTSNHLAPVLRHDSASRGHTRGSIGLATPARTSRSSSVARNSLFSVHMHTGSTNTPMITPAGAMFASALSNPAEHFPETSQRASETENTGTTNT